MELTRFAATALLLVLLACDRGEAPGVPPAPSASRQTSFVSVLRVEGSQIAFRVSAPPERPLLIENCNGTIGWGVEREAFPGAPAWMVEMNACHSAPIVITPGASRDFSGEVVQREWRPIASGRYRLAVYGLLFSHEGRNHDAVQEVPHAQRVSEPFSLNLSPL